MRTSEHARHHNSVSLRLESLEVRRLLSADLLHAAEAARHATDAAHHVTATSVVVGKAIAGRASPRMIASAASLAAHKAAFVALAAKPVVAAKPIATVTPVTKRSDSSTDSTTENETENHDRVEQSDSNDSSSHDSETETSESSDSETADTNRD